jgi:uncharacterized protein
MSDPDLYATIHSSISSVCATSWTKLVGQGSPFLDHGFLEVLEDTGCVGGETGWHPAIITVAEGQEDGSAIIAAAPMYVKTHSAGEFVFDWAWADAAHRAGISYYPKAVIGVPFSPVAGERLLVDPRVDAAAARRFLIEAIVAFATRSGLSSVHFNFLTDEDRGALQELDIPIRIGMQYHWNNGTDPTTPYENFSDYLGRFRSKRRANIRRERRRLSQAGVTTEVRLGETLSDLDMARIYSYYRDTVHRHFHGRQYLNEAFFLQIRKRLAKRLHLVFALRDGAPFAGAFNLQKGNRLYGRYWGCEDDVEFAHFEVCIYKPILWCIEKGIGFFEPGAGGEHKFERGFRPTPTYSAHVMLDERLDQAVRGFVEQEAMAVQRQIEHLQGSSPLTDPQ